MQTAIADSQKEKCILKERVLQTEGKFAKINNHKSIFENNCETVQGINLFFI